MLVSRGGGDPCHFFTALCRRHGDFIPQHAGNGSSCGAPGLTVVARDGFSANGRGHPRTAAPGGRVLSHYAERNSAAPPRPGHAGGSPSCLHSDSDGVAPMARTRDRSRWGPMPSIGAARSGNGSGPGHVSAACLPSVGFRHVLVNGVPVVVDGVIRDSVYPGSEARSPARIDRQGDGKPGVRRRGGGPRWPFSIEASRPMPIRLLVFALCWPLVGLGAQDGPPLTADTRLRVRSEQSIVRVETGSLPRADRDHARAVPR